MRAVATIGYSLLIWFGGVVSVILLFPWLIFYGRPVVSPLLWVADYFDWCHRVQERMR